jgi:hypothetical protein
MAAAQGGLHGPQCGKLGEGGRQGEAVLDSKGCGVPVHQKQITTLIKGSESCCVHDILRKLCSCAKLSEL